MGIWKSGQLIPLLHLNKILFFFLSINEQTVVNSATPKVFQSDALFFVIAMTKIFKDDLQKTNLKSVYYFMYIGFKKQACYTVVCMYS